MSVELLDECGSSAVWSSELWLVCLGQFNRHGTQQTLLTSSGIGSKNIAQQIKHRGHAVGTADEVANCIRDVT